jgi:hypothetical protein
MKLKWKKRGGERERNEAGNLISDDFGEAGDILN